jgi:hypothetical protein
MQKPLSEFESALQRLNEKVKDLESRLATLEQRPENMNIFSVPARPVVLPPSHPVQQLSEGGSGGAMPSIGKVFLGIAGAYVLRALAESGTFPRLAVAGVAIIYAAMWLFGSARAVTRFASIAYGTAAALIIFPLVWEVTVRFQLLPGSVSAGVLFAFALMAALLAWRQNLAPVAWVTTCFACATALGLLVATRNPAPYVVALLLIALATEAAAWRDHWMSLRPMVALAADLSILALIAVYTGREGASAEYASISSTGLLTFFVALAVIYAASTAVRTFAGRRTITWFESGQTTLAFVIATIGALRATHGAAEVTIGSVSLALAAVCYVAAFTWFDDSRTVRNHYAYATWASALLVCGAFVGFPDHALSTWLSLSALVSMAAAVRTTRLMLALHAMLFLGVAAWSSGLLAYIAASLAGTPAAPVWMIVVAGITTIAVGVYGWRFQAANKAASQAVRMLLAAAAILTTAAFLVGGMVALGAASTSGPSLAVIRTLIAVVIALACGVVGSKLERRELIWLAYGVVGLCTVKLLAEDLRNGTAASLAVSMFLYGMVWLLLPRLARSSAANSEAPEQAMAKRMAG